METTLCLIRLKAMRRKYKNFPLLLDPPFVWQKTMSEKLGSSPEQLGASGALFTLR